ncbi:MAG: hypothetical protein FRX48_09533 [Lasallia pustulata]|uniref:Uncharacterized protein n=1 Tax=Lasallia pustulata TaxID=136370 RepID=A0A5M8PBY5_9LECA|nr:MAG: hypothetical protein FRX48_09533 [Lasallia pustulata]
MRKFYAKDPEKSKPGTCHAIQQGHDDEYGMYGKYNKYDKTYNKVAMADYQAPNPKGEAKEKLKDAVFYKDRNQIYSRV